MLNDLIARADALYRRELRLRAEAAAAALDRVNADIDAIEGQIARSELSDDLEATYEDVLEAAIEREQPVMFEYVDREGLATTRTMSPYELYEARNGDELVRGFDHDRDALRSFRLDAIASAPGLALAHDYVLPDPD